MLKNVFEKYGKYITLVVILLSFGLLFIPGFCFRGNDTLNGYEFIFRARYVNDVNIIAQNASSKGHPVTFSIVAMVLLVLSIPLFLFEKKSSAFPLVGGIIVAVAAVSYLAMQGTGILAYRETEALVIGPVSYVNGVLLAFCSVFEIAKGVAMLKQEKTHPAKYSYSYLKK